MYLHLGQDTVVKKKDIIGIFDMDTTTVSKISRDYLNFFAYTRPISRKKEKCRGT